jgi:4-amino-4-deoxy-L-arabinose transferase-like glycosyltransferase
MRLWCGLVQDQNSTAGTPKLAIWQEMAFLVATISAFLAVEVRAAALRSLWYDELSTMLVSSAPTIRALFRAAPVDGNPPLYFLLARLCLHLPIRPEIALRLPSIVAANITALLIYLFVRRNSDRIFAFFAMSVFLGSELYIFGAIEGRPYALLLCWTAAGICCWQSAAHGKGGRLALAGIAACMAGAIFSHQYGVIYLTVPLVAGECVRSWRARRIDLKVAGAALAGATSLLITFPPMLHAQAGLLKAIKDSPVFWSRPNLTFLADYLDTVPKFIPNLLWMIGLPAILLYIVLPKRGSSGELTERSQWGRVEDLAVGVALVLILPIMLVLTGLGTGYFWERYGIGSALGVALVCGLLFSWLNKQLPLMKAVVFAGIPYCLVVAIVSLWLSGPITGSPGAQSDPLFVSAPAGEPLVIADAVVFSPTWWYSDQDRRRRLHYLSDISYAVKQPDFIPEYSLMLEQPYGAPKLDDYKEFLAEHREFLLYCYGMPRLEWVKNRLSDDGWHLIPIRSEGPHELFRVVGPNSAQR